jgi:predicted transcriptional regulator of viral defense system
MDIWCISGVEMVTRYEKSCRILTDIHGNTTDVTVRSRTDTFRKACIATAAEWQAAGVTPAQMRSLIRRGYLVQVRRGVYATRGAIASAKSDPRRDHALRVAAVRVWVGRDAVGSHHSAALVHGFGRVAGGIAASGSHRFRT